jgi:hypothetical protein
VTGFVSDEELAGTTPGLALSSHLCDLEPASKARLSKPCVSAFPLLPTHIGIQGLQERRRNFCSRYSGMFAANVLDLLQDDDEWLKRAQMCCLCPAELFSSGNAERHRRRFELQGISFPAPEDFGVRRDWSRVVRFLSSRRRFRRRHSNIVFCSRHQGTIQK